MATTTIARANRNRATQTNAALEAKATQLFLDASVTRYERARVLLRRLEGIAAQATRGHMPKTATYLAEASREVALAEAALIEALVLANPAEELAEASFTRNGIEYAAVPNLHTHCFELWIS